MTITATTILSFLLTGAAISLTAKFLPFVHVRNFGIAVVVGILIALINAGLVWLLGAAGVSVGVGSLTIVGFLLYTVAIMLADQVMSGFRVGGFLWAALFAIIVIVIDMVLRQLFAAVF